jgi:putative Mg2+ transporter-C (MgtC) family protein
MVTRWRIAPFARRRCPLIKEGCLVVRPPAKPENPNGKDLHMNAWWHEVWVTLQAEFADIGDARQLTQITVRLLIAALLGGILGFEREHKGKAAGVRTHMLVALGAALFVLVPQMSGAQADAMSRVVQGVIAGIGFLGAGTILKGKQDEEGHVKGLTTAAGLWMTAAIGVSAGVGREATAVFSTLLALAVFSVMPWIVRKLEGDDEPPG